jgi:hypothetical protein
MGSRANRGSVTRTWPGISTSRSANSNRRSMIGWLESTASNPDALTIRPRWAGEPFDLHACVQALFTIKLPEHATNDLDQQAA